MTDSNKEKDTTRIVSGKMLRRDYIYDKRKAFVIENGREKLVSEILDGYFKEAKGLYPQDGMYKVEEGVFVYLGEY